jgi:hypothetical protein
MFEQVAHEEQVRELRRAAAEKSSAASTPVAPRRTAWETEQEVKRYEEEKASEAARINAEGIARTKAVKEKAAADQIAKAERIRQEALAKDERDFEMRKRRPEIEAAEKERNNNPSRAGMCPVCRTLVQLVGGKFPEQHTYIARDSSTYMNEERTCYPYGAEIVAGPHPMLRSL